MKKLLVAMAMLIFASGAGSAQLVLNTGYNHVNSGLVPVGQQDPYWIKIASYEPPASPITVEAAWAVIMPVGFVPPMSLPAIGTNPSRPSRWLAPRQVPNSTTDPSGRGTNFGRPAYSLFRKCFCLLRGFANATLSIQVRADDNVQVWLNYLPNTLVAPALGQYFPSQGAAHQGFAQQAGPADPGFFREGRNCLYVLVEDLTGNVAFNLVGTVNAAGLMPDPAIGNNGNFGRCGCPSEPNSAEDSPAGRAAGNDREVVRAIARLAEGRRTRALAQGREAHRAPAAAGTQP